MIEKINRELVENSFDTIFDTFKLEIDARAVGHGLREQLVDLVNLYGRINKLATNALFAYQRAKNRYERAESLAYDKVWSVYSSEKTTKQKILLRTIPIVIDGEETCLNDEEDRVNKYEFVYNRGKDKAREISALIEVGRSVLSWDKQEAGQNNYV